MSDPIMGKIELAHQCVSALCSGNRRWTMSVPVRDSDPDILITEALKAAADRIAALEAAIDALSVRCGFPVVTDREQALNAAGNRVERLTRETDELRTENTRAREFVVAWDALETEFDRGEYFAWASALAELKAKRRALEGKP